MEGIISLYDIFAQHRNWYDYKEEELTGEVWMQIKQEMAQASADFAIRLTQLGERWRNAVEKNIEKLHTTASVPAVSNKARCERYRDALEQFSICVRLALENIFTESELNDLHPLTRYWLGRGELRTMVVHTELSKEEAGDVYKNELQSFPVRRMFREIPFLGRYTVFGYKGKAGDEASTPTTPQQSPKDGAEGQQPAANEDEASIPTIHPINNDLGALENLIYRRALKKGYIRLDGQDHYTKGSAKWALIAYMCGRIYCKDRVKEDYTLFTGRNFPATEVKALFNGKDIANNRYNLHKKPPRNYSQIDELFKNPEASH